MNKQDRNEQLLTKYVNARKKAKLKAGIYTLLMVIIIASVLIIALKTDASNIQLVLILLISILWSIYFYIQVEGFSIRNEKRKISKEFVLENLWIERLTEVKLIYGEEYRKTMKKMAEYYTKILPMGKIETEEYLKYIQEILQTVKFYARINEKGLVEIFLKYDTEAKERYYETINAEKFLEQYTM